jgi:acetyl-CoA carboxylase carboxyltransferase component
MEENDKLARRDREAELGGEAARIAKQDQSGKPTARTRLDPKARSGWCEDLVADARQAGLRDHGIFLPGTHVEIPGR